MSFLTAARLFPAIKQVSKTALAVGALQPISTDVIRLAENEITWCCYLRRQLAEKERHIVRSGNPFLPPDPDLLVGDISADYRVVLNKFNVVPHHALLLTREFRPQSAMLDQEDWLAVIKVMSAEQQGLLFYNGGAQAGASQPHRHLQWVPLPFPADSGQRQSRVPLEALFRDLLVSEDECVSVRLPFQHRIWSLSGHVWKPELLAMRYQLMMSELGLLRESADPAPYNLLLTRRWMMVVPRYHESWAGISFNALAFAGSCFFPDQASFDRCRAHGIGNILRALTCP